MRRNSIFNSIPLLKPKRNTFNLSFENKLSTDLFRLTPIMTKEVLPDDVVKLRPEIFCRVSPLLSPIFHRLQIRTYYFFVPTRIIWDDFEKWINPKSGTTEIVPPKIEFVNSALSSELLLTSAAVAPKSLADYLGLNFGVSPEDASSTSDFCVAMNSLFPEGFTVSSLPFRAYQQIYNDWFIDLNNVDLADFSKESGVEQFTITEEDMNQNALYSALLKMRYRAWSPDYFTSALPEPQRGPDVNAFDGNGSGGSGSGGDSGSGGESGGGSVDPSTLAINGNGTVSGKLTSINSLDVLDTKVIVKSDGAEQNLYDFIKAHYSDFGFANVGSAASFVESNRTWYFVPTDGTTTVTFSGHNWLGELNDNLQYIICDDPDNPTHSFKAGLGDIDLKAATKAIYSAPNGIGTVSINASDIADKLGISSSSRALRDGDEPVIDIPAITVEELRIRMQMQSFLERNEVGGSRYTEMLYAHWGVKDPDGRLQRSEFLGGCKQPIVISDITSTVNQEDEPLGMYAGHGISSSAGKVIKYRVPEHGFIIGLTCIVPRAGYSQGIHPMWTRFDRLDYYWPSFAHLGEQEVKNRELMFTGFDPDGTFGYQQRYAEYKCSNDECHGDMKGSLSHWHMSRMFATPESEDDLPKLSDFFTTPQDSNSDDLSRVWPVSNAAFEVQNADHFVLDIYQHFVASRRMPKFVTPRNGS